MIQVEPVVQHAKKVVQDLRKLKEKERKAFEIAVRVEAFRQLRQLRDEVRQGKPGGRPYAADLLSKLASYTKRGKPKKNQIPLSRLSRLVRVNIKNAGTDNVQISFGFVNTNTSRLSSSYKQILLRHQEGIDVLYTRSRTELGRRFARIGGRLEKAGSPDAKYFFLRKTTGRTIDLPARDIINTYWRQNKISALKQIRRNYRLKLRGERI